MSSGASEQESRPFIDSGDLNDNKKDNPPPYRPDRIFEGSFVGDDADLMHAGRNCSRPNTADCSDGIDGGFVDPDFQNPPKNPQYPQHPPNPAYPHQLQEGQQSSQSITPLQPHYGAYGIPTNYTANQDDVNGKLRYDAYYSPQGMPGAGQQQVYLSPPFHDLRSVAASCPPSLTTGQYVVMHQPQGSAGQPCAIIVRPILENPPSDYMSYSLCAAFCCCFLVGLMAISRSRECRKAILDGNRALAEKKSRSALNTANVAVGLGILLLIVLSVIIGIRVSSYTRVTIFRPSKTGTLLQNWQ